LRWHTFRARHLIGFNPKDHMLPVVGQSTHQVASRFTDRSTGHRVARP